MTGTPSADLSQRKLTELRVSRRRLAASCRSLILMAEATRVVNARRPELDHEAMVLNQAMALLLSPARQSPDEMALAERALDQQFLDDELGLTK